MLGKAVQAEVQPMQDVNSFLETFLSNMLSEPEKRENEGKKRNSTETETSSIQQKGASESTAQAAEAAPAAVTRTAAPAVVYTPARTPGRGRLGLSGTPSRALRSQFDDAADAAVVPVPATAAPEQSDVAADSAALGSTIKLATVIVDNQATATPVRRSARKVQGNDEDATLGDRKAVLSLLHATNFQFAPNPSLSNRRESVGMSVIDAAEENSQVQQSPDSFTDELQDVSQQDAAVVDADDAAAFLDGAASASTAQAAEAAPAAVTRTAAPAVVYTPARTPGRGRLGLSGTPARFSLHACATPGTDVFYTPASSFSPSTPSGFLGADSPVLLASPKVFR